MTPSPGTRGGLPAQGGDLALVLQQHREEDRLHGVQGGLVRGGAGVRARLLPEGVEEALLLLGQAAAEVAPLELQRVQEAARRGQRAAHQAASGSRACFRTDAGVRPEAGAAISTRCAPHARTSARSASARGPGAGESVATTGNALCAAHASRRRRLRRRRTRLSWSATSSSRNISRRPVARATPT